MGIAQSSNTMNETLSALVSSNASGFQSEGKPVQAFAQPYHIPDTHITMGKEVIKKATKARITRNMVILGLDRNLLKLDLDLFHFVLE